MSKPYAVVRAVDIDAPPSAVRRQLEDLHAWTEWSPWPPLDPETKVRSSGPVTGVGARLEWDNDPKIGPGHLEIVDSQDAMVVCDMDSEKPRSGGNVMVFLLNQTESGTRLTWTMHGEVYGIRRWGAWVWPMSKQVGPGFTKGLGKLKAIIEGAKHDGSAHQPDDGER